MTPQTTQARIPSVAVTPDAPRLPPSPLVEETPLDMSRMLYSLVLEVDGLIKQADQKAQTYLTVNTFMVTGIVTLVTWWYNRYFDGAQMDTVDLVGFGMMVASVAVVLVAMLYAFQAINPRKIDGPHHPTDEMNVFFYGHIAQVDSEVYVNEFMRRPTNTVKANIMAYIHNKSVIVDKKMNLIHSSAYITFVAALVFLGGWTVLIVTGV